MDHVGSHLLRAREGGAILDTRPAMAQRLSEGRGWFRAIRMAQTRSEAELVGALGAPSSQPLPRIPESRKYWWIMRPYGRRFLAWEILGVIVVLSHAMGMVLWYGEHNAQLHNHRRCIAGGLGPPEHIPTLDTARFLSPNTARTIHQTVVDAVQSAVADPSIPSLSLASATLAALNTSAFNHAKPLPGGFIGWLAALREQRRRTLRSLAELECNGRCVDAAMDVVTGIVEGPPPQPSQRKQPAWVSLALRLSDQWLNRERRRVCRHLHPAAPPRGAPERVCRSRLHRLRWPQARAQLAQALASRHATAAEGKATEWAPPRCVELRPPPQCGRMCTITDRLRIVSDLYNFLNFILLFFTAFRIPKRSARRASFLPAFRRRRSMSLPAGAASSALEASEQADGGDEESEKSLFGAGARQSERGAQHEEQEQREPELQEGAPPREEEHTHEFSPRAIALHRLTRPYLPLQLLLAIPSYTLVVHAAGVSSPKHALVSHLRHTLVSRVRADPAAAVRFLVRTGIAANFTKILRGIKMLLVSAAMPPFALNRSCARTPLRTASTGLFAAHAFPAHPPRA